MEKRKERQKKMTEFGRCGWCVTAFLLLQYSREGWDGTIYRYREKRKKEKEGVCVWGVIDLMMTCVR